MHTDLFLFFELMIKQNHSFKCLYQVVHQSMIFREPDPPAPRVTTSEQTGGTHHHMKPSASNICPSPAKHP